MNTLSQQLTYYANCFTTGKRADGTEYVYQATEDEELHNALYQAHGDKLPDDWTYRTFAYLLERLAETEVNTLEALEEVRYEVIDSMIDIYTYDLTAWLHSDINNVYYLSDVLQEGNTITDGFQLLSAAQAQAINELYQAIIDLLDETNGRNWSL